MLQISKTATTVNLSDQELLRLQKQWQEKHFIHLPGLIEPGLLEGVRKALGRGTFLKQKHEGVDATESVLKRDSTITMLEMMAGEPTFSNAISNITGAKPVGHFLGRVYNISKSDHDDWHDDAGADYLMAMSINFSPKPYKGGYLELRDKETKKIFGNVQNLGPGDALIFEISKDLEHKITPVKGNHPKIAFAGWFSPQPHYEDHMSEAIRRIIKKSTITVLPSEVEDSPRLIRPELPKIKESVAFRSVGNRTLLIDLEDDSQTVLNRMGSKIWASLFRRESPGQTIAELQKTYDFDIEELKTEYRDLVEELIHVGHLKV